METKPGSLEEFVKLTNLIKDHEIIENWDDVYDSSGWVCLGTGCIFTTRNSSDIPEHFAEMILAANFHLVNTPTVISSAKLMINPNLSVDDYIKQLKGL